MKSFEYSAPQSLGDAVALLSQQWGETEILAGGTDLITCLKQGLVRPKRLVSLRHVKELRGIDSTRIGVRIGAMTPLEEVAKHDTIRQRFPSITTAISGIGSPQLLSVGTIGGDLCQRPRCWYYRNGFGLMATHDGTPLVRDGQNQFHSVFSSSGTALFVSASSLGPPLIALDASLTLAGPDGNSRRVEAADFFRTPQSDEERETVLRPNEILTEIVIPDRGLRNATYEIRHRQGMDWPYVTASTAFSLVDGIATGARVVLGQVAPVPWMARAAGRALEAAKVDASSAGRSGDTAVQGAQPLSRNAYKLPMIRVAVRRAILAAAAG